MWIALKRKIKALKEKKSRRKLASLRAIKVKAGTDQEKAQPERNSHS